MLLLLERPTSERERFTRFLVVGAIAAAVNVVSRYLLNSVASFEAAVAIAYVFGMTTAFVLNRSFVFEPSGSSIKAEYARFAMVNVVAMAQVWIVSVGLALFIFPAIGMIWHPETVAHVVGVASPIVTSYLGHKRFSFRA